MTQEVILRTCYKCKLEKPLIGGFSKDKTDTSGYNRLCKACAKLNWNKHRDKYLKQAKEYRKLHKERDRVTRSSYWYKRFFHTRAANLLARDPEHVRDGSTRSKEAIKHFTSVLSRLWKQQRGICPLTRRRLNALNSQLDHIIPLKKGGSVLDVANLRWVHRDVNYAKRDLMDEDFIRLCYEVTKVFYKEQADIDL